jgi:hypothetical protein
VTFQPDVSMIEASFISGHNEITESSSCVEKISAMEDQTEFSTADKVIQTSFTLTRTRTPYSRADLRRITKVAKKNSPGNSSSVDIFDLDIPIHQAYLCFMVG